MICPLLMASYFSRRRGHPLATCIIYIRASSGLPADLGVLHSKRHHDSQHI